MKKLILLFVLLSSFAFSATQNASLASAYIFFGNGNPNIFPIITGSTSPLANGTRTYFADTSKAPNINWWKYEGKNNSGVQVWTKVEFVSDSLMSVIKNLSQNNKSVTNATIINGNLTFSYSDGTSQNLGNIIGPQGPPGTGGSGGMQTLNSFYELFTTPNLTTSAIKYFDAASKLGSGIFIWIDGATNPTIIGECVNRGSGCFIRADKGIYNAIWCGTQDLPMGTTAQSISSYGKMNQAQADQMFGASFINVNTDTYDYMALKYAFSLLSKIGYSTINLMPGHLYQVNKGIALATYYETITGEWNRMPSDRKTETGPMTVLFNHSVIHFNNNSASALIYSNGVSDYPSSQHTINRAYDLEDAIFDSDGGVNDTALYLISANHCIVHNCKFYGFKINFSASYTMHLLIDKCDFYNRGYGIYLTYRNINGGSGSGTPANGTMISNCHFSGNNGLWSIYSEETDNLVVEHPSFEGGVMLGDIYIEAQINGGTDKGGAKITDVRCEHTCSTAIIAAKFKQGLIVLDGLYDQYGNVWVQAESVWGNYGQVNVSNIQYQSSAGTATNRFRSIGTSATEGTHWNISNCWDLKDYSQVIWDTTNGGVVPAPAHVKFNGTIIQ